MSFGGPPEPDTFEMSLFGTGVGESLAIHAGHGDWFLIDSCRQSQQDLPAHLSYLQQIGVNCSEAIKRFIITHWHDDHIDGAFDVVRECSSAKIVISSALSCDEFRKTLSIYNERDYSLDRETSGVRELGRILNFLNRKKNGQQTPPFVKTQSDHLLFRSDECDLFALSPSDTSIEKAIREFASSWGQIEKGGQRVILGRPKRNHNSIALWVRFKGQRILLGSDLEVSGESDTGWEAVPKCNLFPDQKACIFKIPHHGSPNGDHRTTWEQLVVSETPVLAVTSYSRGKTPRPSETDFKRLLARTTELYCTTVPGTSLPHLDRTVERTIKEVVRKRWPIKKNLGHIRIRWKGLEDEEPLVELFGDAIMVSPR